MLFALLSFILVALVNAASTEQGAADMTAIDNQCAAGGVAYTTLDSQEHSCCLPPSGITWLDERRGIGQCCPDGHKWTGDKTAGKGGCCPIGYTFIHGQCTPAHPPAHKPHNVCRSSKIPVCASDKDLGIEYGHCYILTFTDGVQLGAQRDDTTYAKGGYFRDIPFKVCKSTTDCSDGGAVPTNGTFFLQDQVGRFNDAKGTKGWINNASGGTHIGFTTNAALAGSFKAVPSCSGGRCTLRLGGGPTRNGGIGPTCPMPNHGITFWPNPRVGMMLEFTETACDGPDAAFQSTPAS